MRAKQHAPSALTLIELLVVIAIIIALAALAAAFLPRLSQGHTFANAANTMQGWLLGAKMRAKRDGLPTGIRLLTATGQPGICTSLQLIQQPDVFTSRKAGAGYLDYTRTWQAIPGKPGQFQGVYTITQQDNGIDFTDGQSDPHGWLVQVGDRILFQGGSALRITAMAPVAGGMQLTAVDGASVAGPPAASPSDNLPATTNWKVYRQPRRIMGEADLELPNQTVIDLAAMQAAGMTLTQGPPQLNPDGTPAGPCYDILFASSGALAGTSGGMMILWVRSAEITIPSPQLDLQALVAVNARNGFIQVSEVAPGANPFLYVQTGRASGM